MAEAHSEGKRRIAWTYGGAADKVEAWRGFHLVYQGERSELFAIGGQGDHAPKRDTEAQPERQSKNSASAFTSLLSAVVAEQVLTVAGSIREGYLIELGGSLFNKKAIPIALSLPTVCVRCTESIVLRAISSPETSDSRQA